MSDAKVLKTAIVAMRWFGGNYESALNCFLSRGVGDVDIPKTNLLGWV